MNNTRIGNIIKIHYDPRNPKTNMIMTHSIFKEEKGSYPYKYIIITENNLKMGKLKVIKIIDYTLNIIEDKLFRVILLNKDELFYISIC